MRILLLATAAVLIGSTPVGDGGRLARESIAALVAPGPPIATVREALLRLEIAVDEAEGQLDLEVSEAGVFAAIAYDEAGRARRSFAAFRFAAAQEQGRFLAHLGRALARGCVSACDEAGCAISGPAWIVALAHCRVGEGFFVVLVFEARRG